ncbi:MAG: rRNA maturation RNase YbeY [Candidatus Yanofskybacteria bacterium]|nr:rRNA maturation RNase YbeY [Candidatus Yanofskybacteria bacterium]
MLDLVFRNLTGDTTFPESFFKKLFACALEELAWSDQDIEVSVSLVSNEEIRKLNKKHRNKDSVTDVLSFPMGEQITPSPINLGDVFICPKRVGEDAQQQNIAEDKRMAWAAIHGFLHLAGYDHEVSETEAKKMSELEQKVLAKCGF